MDSTQNSTKCVKIYSVPVNGPLPGSVSHFILGCIEHIQVQDSQHVDSLERRISAGTVDDEKQDLNTFDFSTLLSPLMS